MANPRIELLQALAVTAELTNTELSEAAATVMADDLSTYPHAQVLGALVRCRRELRGRLTIAAVLERLDDGRPGPNEAWAMIPQDEDGSVVWSDEMAQAFGAAQPLISAGQTIAARSAFLEAYERLVAHARAEARPPRWTPSLGHDKRHRASAIETAQRFGRISAEHAAMLLPAPESATVTALLAAPRSAMPDEVREQLAAFARRIKAAP
jgi:hypothetical protein